MQADKGYIGPPPNTLGFRPRPLRLASETAAPLSETPTAGGQG